MTSSRPYLLRAIFEWIVDNGHTPHILVDARQSGVQVPNEYVQDGHIVLNISPSATQGLSMGNERLGFSARFGGRPRQIEMPVGAILAIYARENGMGMEFGSHGPGIPTQAPQADGGEELFAEELDFALDDGDDPEPPPRGRPSLRVVK